MKKHLLLLVLFFLAIVQYTNSQELKQENQKTEETKTQSMFRHWSIAWNGGMSLLDGDFTSNNGKGFIPTSSMNFAFNAQVEYMIGPIWGIYLEYSYLPWSGALQNKTYYAKGMSHDVALNATINILNLFRSNRSQTSNWALNINVGAGLAFFNASSYEYDKDKEKPIFENVIEQKYVPQNNKIVFPLGFTVEYSPIACLGVFLQAEYRMYQFDGIDGISKGTSKDFMAYAGLGLRYKIAANKKRGHVKTISIMDHNPDITDRAMMSQKTQEQQVAALSAKVDNMTDIMNNSIIPKIEAITKNQEENSTDSDLDGVPDSRDRHSNTPAGSFVNYYGEPLTEAEISKILGASSNKPEATIYYELNSHDINKNGELSIAQIASKLYNNHNFKAEIVGYCDNSGSDEFNYKLSLKRAETVKNILVKQFGIDANRITVVGKGKTKGPKDKFIVNRRCDIFIIK